MSLLGDELRAIHEGGWRNMDSWDDLLMFADDLDGYEKTIIAKDRRIAELEAIVNRLPETADGVPVVPGDTVWWPYDDRDFGEGPHEMEVGQFWKWSSEQEDWEDDKCGIAVPCAYIEHDWVSRDLRDCYSTREAAEKAQKKSEA